MKQIIIFSLSVALARSACLPEASLKALGFDAVQTSATIAAPTVCTDLFKTAGACVPEASVKAKLEADSSALAGALKGYNKMFSSMIDVQLSTLSLAKAADAQVAAMKEQLSTLKNGCVNAYSTLQQGITCYLASSEASTHTTTDGSIAININRSTAGAALAACNDLINFMCTYTAGVSMSTSVYASTGFTFDNEAQFKTACTELNTNIACSTPECLTTKYDLYINTFFKPYDYTLFPTADVGSKIGGLYEDALSAIKKAAGSIGSITDKIKDAFGGSDLLGESSSRKLAENSNVTAKSSATGADVKEYGTNSGYDKVEAGSAYLISTLFALVFATLLK